MVVIPIAGGGYDGGGGDCAMRVEVSVGMGKKQSKRIWRDQEMAALTR